MKTPPGFEKHIMTFTTEAAVNATKELFNFTAKQAMIPIALRITPLAATGTNPTCVMSMAAGTTKLSTDNTVTTLAAATTLEATFAAGKTIAIGDALKITATLGGTNPVYTGSVVEFEFMS
jgi:hypothetical protein